MGGCGVSYKQHSERDSLKRKEPDAFRNCTCGLTIWSEPHLPVQASNQDSGVQGGEETGMTLWSSQCRQGHTGVLMSKGAQESVLCHSLACLWHMCG